MRTIANAPTISPRLKDFRQFGFLVLDNFVDHSACDRLRTRGEELVKEFDPQGITSIFSTRDQNRISDEYFLTSGDKICFFFEEEAFLPDGDLKQAKEHSINKIGHALHDRDPVFDHFSRTKELKQLAAELGFKQPRLLQSMYIFKQPKIGGEVRCHQDSTFLYTEPTEIVGLWFALEDATVDNGCLWAIPGGHRGGLKSRWVRNPHNEMNFDVFDSSPFSESELVPLEVSKGSLILLHGLVPHKSLANRSLKSRHAYTLHLIEHDWYYPESNWLQRPHMPLRGFD